MEPDSAHKGLFQVDLCKLTHLCFGPGTPQVPRLSPWLSCAFFNTYGHGLRQAEAVISLFYQEGGGGKRR